MSPNLQFKLNFGYPFFSITFTTSLKWIFPAAYWTAHFLRAQIAFNSSPGILSSKRKICFGLALIGGTWLSERSLDIKLFLARKGLNTEKVVNNSSLSSMHLQHDYMASTYFCNNQCDPFFYVQLWQVVKVGAMLHKFFSLMNFIIFLQDARLV